MMLRFNVNPKAILVIITIALFALLLVIMPGCYNLKKANAQHGKAVTTFPAIGADYCARVYPAKDSLIIGDSVVSYDTIYTGGQMFFDTVQVKDTVRITTTIQLPAKTIIQKIRQIDTIVKINHAALDLCSIERRSAITQLEKKTAEYDDMKSKRNKWRKSSFITWGILTLGLIGFIYRKTKKPV